MMDVAADMLCDIARWGVLLMPLVASVVLVYLRRQGGLPLCPPWLGAMLGGSVAWAATPSVVSSLTGGRNLSLTDVEGIFPFFCLLAWVVLAIPTAAAIGAAVVYTVGRIRPPRPADEGSPRG
ncbi:MAG: hypothetical protein KKI08_15795 [Armatimonadetes bacterium]|nr:hypothetical protein [Armatimonadota bacterium]